MAIPVLHVVKVSNTKSLIRPLRLFCWVFFLEHKDETYLIFKNFINLVENQLNKKVKAIRCDTGTEFKNAYMIELCGSKGIKREYSNPRTPQQNGVAERKNKTLIEVARTMLADSKLPTMFWTDAVRTACYVLNRVSVTSPHNKTPYALLTGNIPIVRHFKPLANQSVGTQGNTTNSADQEQRVISDAEELRIPAGVKAVIPGCIPVPTGRVLVPGSVQVPTGSITVATDRIPVPVGDTTVLVDLPPENQLNKKIKAMRCDNGTKFKNAHIIELCRSKGIKREYSNARTLQQNRVAERKNKTLIEAARTMLADSKLPTMF
nr:putative ribonuclease H-like domain-containing protein [Tanacetum cinerariifolium]